MIGGTTVTGPKSRRVRGAYQPHDCGKRPELQSGCRRPYLQFFPERESTRKTSGQYSRPRNRSDYIITSTFDFSKGRFFNDLESARRTLW